MTTAWDLAAVAVAWALYGLLHSLLAGEACKRWLAQRFPRLHPGYRLLYNLLAGALLLPLLWLTWRLPGEPLWTWPGWISWPALVASATGFVWSLRWYDGAEFLGWRQLRDAGATEDRLVLSPLHRWVRHPWYSLGLLALWTRDLNSAWLAAAVTLTVYVVIGSRIEEQRLLGRFGDSYRRYRARVPALLPRPWRHLDADEARDWRRD